MNIDFTKAKTIWENNNFLNNKKTVIRTPVTKIEDNMSGSERLVEGTADSTYEALFFRKEDVWKTDNSGLFQDSDAIIIVKTSQTLNINDKITFDSQNYRVKTAPINRYMGSTAIYKVAQLFRT